MNQSRYRFIDPSKIIVVQDDASPSHKSKEKLHSPVDSFQPVKIKHRNIQDYIDQVEDKTILAALYNEEKLKQLNFPVINQLDRVRQQLAKLDEKLKQQESIETHPQIQEDVQNLAKVEQYKNSLVAKATKLNETLELNNKNIMTLQQQVFAKRLQIRDMVQESWHMQNDLLKLKEEFAKKYQMKRKARMAVSMDVLPKSAKFSAQDSVFLTGTMTLPSKQLSKLPPLKSRVHLSTSQQILNLTNWSQQIQSSTAQNEKINELLSILTKLETTENQIKMRKNEIAKRCTRFNSIKKLLSDSIDAGSSDFNYQQFKQKVFKTNRKFLVHLGMQIQQYSR